MTLSNHMMTEPVPVASWWPKIKTCSNQLVTKHHVDEWVPCQSSTVVPLQMTVHSEIPTVSWCRSREHHQSCHDPVDRPSCPPSEHCPTTASAHGSEILSHVHGRDHGQIPALSQLHILSSKWMGTISYNTVHSATSFKQLHNTKILVFHTSWVQWSESASSCKLVNLEIILS